MPFTAPAPLDDDVDTTTIAQRFDAAWADRSEFLAEWAGRVRSRADAAAVDLQGLSRVGQMRAMGAASDPMSQMGGEKEFDGLTQLNKWFNDMMKGDK